MEKYLPTKEDTIPEVSLTQIQNTYYKAIYENNTSFLLKDAKTGKAPSLMDFMMYLRKCCNQLFLIHGAEEQILSDADYSGSHHPEQDKSAILSKLMLLMETPL